MGHWKRKSVAVVIQVALSPTRPFLLSGIYFHAVVTGAAAPSRAVLDRGVGFVAYSDSTSYSYFGRGGELEPPGECGACRDIPGGAAAEGGRLGWE